MIFNDFIIFLELEVDNNVCDEKQDAGSCSNWTIKFYYDDALKLCGPFYYGGCDGTRNRFDSIESCQSICLGIEVVLTTLPTTSQTDAETSLSINKGLPKMPKLRFQSVNQSKPKFFLKIPYVYCLLMKENVLTYRSQYNDGIMIFIWIHANHLNTLAV